MTPITSLINSEVRLWDCLTALPPPRREEVERAEKAMRGIDALIDMIVSSDNCPVELKIEFSILQTMKATTDALHTLCEPIATEKTNVSLAEKKALLEYLTLVKAGIEQYKIHKTEE